MTVLDPALEAGDAGRVSDRERDRPDPEVPERARRGRAGPVPPVPAGLRHPGRPAGRPGADPGCHDGDRLVGQELDPGSVSALSEIVSKSA